MVDTRHLHTMQAAVTIPLAQAAVTGGLTAAVVMSAAALTGAPALTGLAAGMAATLAEWMTLTRQWRALVWGVETISGCDVDGDGHIGEPEPQEPARVDVWLHRPNGATRRALPVTREQLTAWASGIASGLSLSEPTWTGSGKPFSRAEYRGFRDALIRYGWAQWRDPNVPQQGWELTRAGQAVVRALINGRGGMRLIDATTPPQEHEHG